MLSCRTRSLISKISFNPAYVISVCSAPSERRCCADAGAAPEAQGRERPGTAGHGGALLCGDHAHSPPGPAHPLLHVHAHLCLHCSAGAALAVAMAPFLRQFCVETHADFVPLKRGGFFVHLHGLCATFGPAACLHAMKIRVHLASPVTPLPCTARFSGSANVIT